MMRWWSGRRVRKVLDSGAVPASPRPRPSNGMPLWAPTAFGSYSSASCAGTWHRSSGPRWRSARSPMDCRRTVAGMSSGTYRGALASPSPAGVTTLTPSSSSSSRRPSLSWPPDDSPSWQAAAGGPPKSWASPTRSAMPATPISFGVGDEETERLIAMRQALDEGQEEHTPTWDELVDRFGSDAPDGVRLAVVTRIENPEPG